MLVCVQITCNFFRLNVFFSIFRSQLFIEKETIKFNAGLLGTDHYFPGGGGGGGGCVKSSGEIIFLASVPQQTIFFNQHYYANYFFTLLFVL